MKFFYVENLAKLSMKSDMLPWDFKLVTPISLQIRKDKVSRQNWYQNADTVHNYYTPLEPANPNMRPSKENPPRAIHALAVDYDVAIPQARVDEAVKALKIKPAWTERSLGGNVRLIWTFPRPIYTETYEFTCFVLEKTVPWLNLEILPGLDVGALTTPTRLLCNGGEWTPTGAGPVPEAELQAFFVKCAKEFRFNGGNGADIPLEIVEAELKKRFPNFNWPNDFVAETQGPTFWIPESTSPLSAILKSEGFITFSAHADKPFYSWSDILGGEFVRQFYVESISKATADIWWDSKRFWRKKKGRYVPTDVPELTNYFKINCRLSQKPGEDGTSTIENALNHIYNENDVEGAAPFVFRPGGRIEYQGRQVLNTYVNRALKPADEPQEWGVNFAWCASMLTCLFEPLDQLWHFLAWWKHAYISALTMTPMPGQNIFLMGGAGVGKTLLNRYMVGPSLGGFADASELLLNKAAFNSEFYEAPLWCIDDETSNGSESIRQAFSAMLKKVAANQSFKYNKKFEVGAMIEWMGRVFTTLNLDFVSSRILGSFDNTSLDKTNLYRCVKETAHVFESRKHTAEMIAKELPYLLRWLLDWEPPATIERCPRYGYKSFQEPSLMNKANQGNTATPFKELISEEMLNYFRDNPNVTEWRGSMNTLLRFLSSNPMNEIILRSLKLEQANRYIELIEREGVLPCHADISKENNNERVWVFPRPLPNQRPAE